MYKGYKKLTRKGLEMTGESLSTKLVEVPLDFYGEPPGPGEKIYIIVNSLQDMVYLKPEEVQDE